MPKPVITPQTTTLWQYPSQHYREGMHGDANYRGATPSWVIWNLLERYTVEGELVVDPMAGSGTTLDVARDMGRRALAYDVAPARKEVFRADARSLPLEAEKACFVFVDPPYGDNLKYSGQVDCIGELPADGAAYWIAMEDVLSEILRILRPGRHAAMYVCDVWKRSAFVPIGARLTALIEKRFEMVDHVAVVRGNKDLKKGNYHKAAEETNFFLRGFNHLLIFRKPEGKRSEVKARSSGVARPNSSAPRRRSR